MRSQHLLAVCLVACVAVAAGAPEVVVMPLQKTLKPRLHRDGELGSGPVVNPVEGSIWPTSIFWSFIEVGTPPQRFPVAIDSGSFTLNIPVRGCNGCITKAPNNQYDPTASKTSHAYKCSLFSGCPVGSCSNGMCSYSNTYETCDPTDPSQPCTISGPFYTDVVSWGSAGPVNVTFGGIDYQTPHFYQFETVDGVCGMASPSGSQSVFGSLVAQGAIPANEWGLCLHHGTTSNGTITLGGTDDRLFTGDIKYTPDIGQGFYSMGGFGMKVGGQTVSGLLTQTVIDSGTNDLLISQEGLDSVRSIIEGMCSSKNLKGVCGVSKNLFDGACFEITPEEMAMFPDFTIQVTGIDLTMTPKDYLLLDQPGVAAGLRCLGIGVIGGGLQIVGDSLMENYYVVFDVANQRIGWAPVNTDNCGSL